MSQFNPSKLHVNYMPPTTSYEPVAGRKYTLTHSDKTGDLFLNIGSKYDLNTINKKNRDEVLANWMFRQGQYLLMGKVYVTGGEFNEQLSKIRFTIFQKELPLALTAIIYGDRKFYSYHPYLLDAPIYIQFESSLPEFHRLMYCGTPRWYLLTA
ncbi:staygreen family protein [Metabacillus fastidiosus]|uniref:staygreen family protein n=1 Tax=Metabacillus fastidiosus TaxID=1458 RepID=UPI000825B6C8|nr:staygreen family protein [Metabacillus fastidiosus]MED4462244.1 staygreen family protein [Metabacillus fastidiosus]